MALRMSLGFAENGTPARRAVVVSAVHLSFGWTTHWGETNHCCWQALLDSIICSQCYRVPKPCLEYTWKNATKWMLLIPHATCSKLSSWVMSSRDHRRRDRSWERNERRPPPRDHGRRRSRSRSPERRKLVSLDFVCVSHVFQPERPDRRERDYRRDGPPPPPPSRGGYDRDRRDRSPPRRRDSDRNRAPPPPRSDRREDSRQQPESSRE